jgi:hypothetical protein
MRSLLGHSDVPSALSVNGSLPLADGGTSANLDDRLGHAFGPDTRRAWMMLFEVVREEMIRSAALV